MESVKALHDIGLRHNDLIDMPIRHILYDKLREKAFIIDFSTAEDHECHLRMRMRPYTSTPPEDVFGCDELWYAARNMNLFGHGPCECSKHPSCSSSPHALQVLVPMRTL